MKYSVDFTVDSAIIKGLEYFNLAKTCNCGQAFRWYKNGDWFHGVALGRSILAKQDGKELILSPCSEQEFPVWAHYFDLDRDYEKVERLLSNNEKIACCLEKSSGIRILNQDPFETLITFIISANNNVSRIRGIIERICICAGEAIYDRWGKHYLFPTPKALAEYAERDITCCSSGYRAKNILQTARIVADGYDLEALRNLALSEARTKLMEFPGVGPKVADCVLLFSLGYARAFPIDVWMNRAIIELFFNGKRPSVNEIRSLADGLGPEAGIAQQYIFYYARETKLGKSKVSTNGYEPD